LQVRAGLNRDAKSASVGEALRLVGAGVGTASECGLVCGRATRAVSFASGGQTTALCIVYADLAFNVFFLLVWCWGWDGAGDLDGPDVDPIWEKMPDKSTKADAVVVRHDRSFKL
jgi:hypothetical protein